MNFIKILGASGGKSKTTAPTSFQIYKDIIIDTGNVLNILGDDSLYVNHIFLTHAHSDHILDLPFLIEGFFEQREEPLRVYALQETIDSVKKHTFNNEIWPDFSNIPLLNSDQMSLIFHPITVGQTVQLREYDIKAIKANHVAGACGFVITKNNESFLISGDTYINDSLIKELNHNQTIKCFLIECSFPNHMEQLALQSKHLTPKLLETQLKRLTRNDLQTFIYHLKPVYHDTMVKQINELDILKNGGKILESGDVIHYNTGACEANMFAEDKFERLIDINLSLSNESNKDKLFEMLLTLTRELTHADAGTIYTLSEDKKYLDFKVIQNDTLDIQMGGTKEAITWDSLPLYLEDGSDNLGMAAVVCALKNKIINIKDVYHNKHYDFNGTKRFDASTGYHSQSILVVPLINHEQDVIGVLQLINKSQIANTIIAFDKKDYRIIKALAGQVAMVLTNNQLITSIDGFVHAFIDTICRAIEAKSMYTKNHIQNVAKISMLLAHAIDQDETVFKEINYTENDFKQIEIASWLHDIGKISMPEAIIDKSTKLEIIIDGIELVKERFEILLRDLEIKYLKNELSKTEYEAMYKKTIEDRIFLEESNIGTEFMSDDKIQRIHTIAQQTYCKDGKEIPLLNQFEITNLCITKGTLTSKEKHLLNSHADLSYDMLSSLPFPKKYKDVMHIAANHHEKLNGKGYPRGLTAKELTLEDRILVLADIFEALTSCDRPYKDGKKLSEVFKILSKMVNEGEIDGTLVKFLHNHDILLTYANQELKQSQIDESSLLF